jgi:hypothetical protein
MKKSRDHRNKQTNHTLVVMYIGGRTKVHESDVYDARTWSYAGGNSFARVVSALLATE